MAERRDHLRLVGRKENRHHDLLKQLDNPPRLDHMISMDGARVRNSIAAIHKRLFDSSVPLPAPFKRTTYQYEPSHDIFDRRIGAGTAIQDQYKNQTLHVRYGVHILSRLLEVRPGLKSTVADHYALTHIAVNDIVKSPDIQQAMENLSKAKADSTKDSAYGRHMALWMLAGGLAADELFGEPTQNKMIPLYQAVGASVLRDLDMGIEEMQSNASMQEKVLPEYLAVIPAPVVGLLSPIMPSQKLAEILGPDLVRSTST